MGRMADEPVPPGVRAQLLATEHWGLLASRSTAQSEVLTRISMFLTLVSASLVSLALVGQATDFSDAFTVFAIAVLGIAVLVGFLTQIRVFNVGMEDLMYVLAMNRLRGAYVEMDPSIARYLMAAPYDDRAGAERTYYFLGRRTSFSQVAGSSMVFIAAVNSAMTGLLIASIVAAFSLPFMVAVVLGMLGGLVYFGITVATGGRRFFEVWGTYRAEFPTPTRASSH